MAKRIQRKRTKGWRMPTDAKYVGRPAGWGNPFVPGGLFRFAENGELVMGVMGSSRDSAVAMFRRYLAARVDLHEQIRSDLGGRDLACWCPLDQPCHADVLLEIAAGGTP
ncbi:DUF4326 domain-containing protein [Phytomonospora sp. NPDC050363]|uniref:DUF4326 domain-containing protein n=1 Tax=Phytomonospora sp. NPDC050363 TaxID=3155642 RepID=UPI0033F79D7A